MGSAQVKPSKASRFSPDVKVFQSNSGEIEATLSDAETSLDDESDENDIGRTHEKMEEYILNLREEISKVQRLDNYNTREEDGTYICTDEAVEVIYMIDMLYGQFYNDKDVSRSEKIEWRKKIAALVVETKFTDCVCEIIKTAYNDRVPTENDKMYQVLILTIRTIQNYTDSSADFSVAVVAYPGFCETVKRMLDELQEGHVSNSQTSSMEALTVGVLAIVHNIGMVESNIGRLREVHFLPILTDYLATPNKKSRLLVFAALAAIINEKESEVIKANVDLVKYLLKVLSEGMATHIHRFNVVRTLARNDANKKLLAQLGALQLMVKMGKIGDQEEQYHGVSALWALSFDVDIRKRIVSDKNLGVVDLLLELKSSEATRIKKVCYGALWTLNDDLRTSPVEQYRKYSTVSVQAKSSNSSVAKAENTGHVMISYQWANQKMLIRIRDKLKAAGIKVWMDISDLEGSTLEAMADAVEKATVVLMCMSQNYKNSDNCRAEAEYAFKKRKTIIPLMMERDYDPDGWLGIICGTKLYYKFIPDNPKYKFEDVMPKLLKEIVKIYEKKGKHVESVVIPTQVPFTALPDRPVDQVDSRPPAAAGTSVTKARLDDRFFFKSPKVVRGWKAGDVQKWSEKHDLKSCGINGLTGEEISILCMMYHRAPESFFKCMQNESKLKQLLKTSRLVWAIDDLVEENNDNNTE